MYATSNDRNLRVAALLSAAALLEFIAGCSQQASNATPPVSYIQSKQASVIGPNAASTTSSVRSLRQVEIGGIRFIEVPPGSFQIGSPDDEPGHQYDERPRWAEIAQPFLIAVTEITEEQYAAFSPLGHGQSRTAGFPMTDITFDEATYFCWAFQAANPGYQVRLPNEAEWEYACRAGTTGPFPSSPSTDLSQAMTKYQLGDPDFLHRKVARLVCFGQNAPCPVDSTEPNAWGLHEMLGNVWEWCEPYDLSPPSNDQRPIRGGGWSSTDVWSCRSASRAWELRETRKSSIGFRIVCISK